MSAFLDENRMYVRMNGKPHQTYTRAGGPYLAPVAASATRIPSGHPEGYLEGFANVYRSAYDAMIQRAEGKPFEKTTTIYPNVNDGVEGMYFIQQSVASSKQNGAWLPLAHKRARR